MLTFFDSRKRLNQDVARILEQEWGELVFQARIRDTVSLAGAPSSGLDIHAYKQASSGAKDYATLVEEFMMRIRGS